MTKGGKNIDFVHVIVISSSLTFTTLLCNKNQKEVDLFESLKGAVYFCIVGKGFSSIQSIYEYVLRKSNIQF